MSKSKGGSKKAADKATPVCALCKNYKAGKGMCGKRDKKRDPDTKACGSFKRR